MKVQFETEGSDCCDRCCFFNMCPKEGMCPCDSWLAVNNTPEEGQEVYFVED